MGVRGARRAAVAAKKVDGQEGDAGADGDVRDVERRPVKLSPARAESDVQLDEVDDGRVANAIDEVAERPAEDERKPPSRRGAIGVETAVGAGDEHDRENRDPDE